jgi:hypothetical protein
MSHDDLRPAGIAPQPLRRALLERVLASQVFSHSPRLSAFLSYICEQDRLGKAGEIREQQIGQAVFGRAEGYDVANDSIVRSQARFLRIRLENYFAGEGREEELVLHVPKGCYQPQFDWRKTARVADPAESDKPQIEPPPQPKQWKRPIAVAAIACLLLLAISLILPRTRHAATQASQTVEARFWSSVLNGQRTAIIVPSDSSLVLIEEMDKRPVSLADYMSRKYLSHAPAGASERLRSLIEISQYTSLADLTLISRIEQNPAISASHMQIRYARDLSLTELKQSNAILIGGVRSNPWVELFRPSMRFAVDYDSESQRNFVRNRNPISGEQERYYETGGQGSHLAYGVIAYLPSLDGRGSALLVGGTSKGGTEAAAEFLLSSSFSEFLRGLDQKDSQAHFEILIEADNVNGESHDGKIVCFHRLG